MKIRILNIVLILLILFSCFSCKKDTSFSNSDTSHLLINNTAEALSNDVFKTFLYTWIVLEDSLYHPHDSLNFRYVEPCMQITLVPFDTITWPKTLSINFPNSDCMCNDGLKRSGTMNVAISGIITHVNSTYKLSFDNYFVNSIPVIGTKSLSIVYSVLSKNIDFNDTVDFNVQYGSDYFQWHAVHDLNWVSGTNTHTIMNDDWFLYNGTSAAVPLSANTSGVSGFQSNIIQSIAFTNWCFWLRAGRVEVLPDNLPARTVQYADSCLQHATYVLNNETFDFNF